MSTIIQEPRLGIPQTQVGAEILNTQPNNIDLSMGQVGNVQFNTPPINNQISSQVENTQFNMPPIPNQEIPQQNIVQNNMVQSGMLPEASQQTQFPSIQDNNPVAELPNTGSTGILEQTIPNISQSNMEMNNPSMNQQIQMQQPAMNQTQPMQPMQQPAMQNPYGQMQQPAMQNPYGQMQQPAMNQPQMQQYGYQAPMQQPTMQNPYGQMQQPAMNQQYGQQQVPMQQPGSTAPGYNQGSYLQNQNGMFGPTPTGHPEKQKIQLQSILVHAKPRTASSGKLFLSGLMNPNIGDRNSKPSNFVCFSESATKQIQLLEDPMAKAQYISFMQQNGNPNFQPIPKFSGQVIIMEGSWQWNSKGNPQDWQFMCDNFQFVNDPALRTYAESWTPAPPPSPMDMLNGGNIQGQAMQNQVMNQQVPMQQYGQQQVPMQQYGQSGQNMQNPFGNQMPGQIPVNQYGMPSQQ